MFDYSIVKKCPENPLSAGYTPLSEFDKASRDEAEEVVGTEKITEHMLGHPGFSAEFREQFCKMNAGNQTLFFVKAEMRKAVLDYLGSRFDYDKIFPITADESTIIDIGSELLLKDKTQNDKFTELKKSEIPTIGKEVNIDKWIIIPNIMINPDVINMFRARFETNPEDPIFKKSASNPYAFYIKNDPALAKRVCIALEEAKFHLDLAILNATKKNENNQIAELSQKKNTAGILLESLKSLPIIESNESKTITTFDHKFFLTGERELERYKEFESTPFHEYGSEYDSEYWGVLDTLIDPEVANAIRAAFDFDPKRPILMVDPENKYRFIVRKHPFVLQMIADRLSITSGRMKVKAMELEKNGQNIKASLLKKEAEELIQLKYNIAGIKQSLEKPESLKALLLLCFLGFGIMSPIGNEVVRFGIHGLKKIAEWFRNPRGPRGGGRSGGGGGPKLVVPTAEKTARYQSRNQYLPETQEVLMVIGLGLLAFFGIKAVQKGAPAFLELLATRGGAAIATAGGIALFSLPALATELKENIESGKTTVGDAVKGYRRQLTDDYVDGFDFWKKNGGVGKTLSEAKKHAHRAAEDKFVESYEFLDKNGVLASYGEAAGYVGDMTANACEAIIDGIINIF